MIDQAECILDSDSTEESVKVFKVFNHNEDEDLNRPDGDVEMKDDATTNASPDQ
jgi:hypothetical protein